MHYDILQKPVTLLETSVRLYNAVISSFAGIASIYMA